EKRRRVGHSRRKIEAQRYSRRRPRLLFGTPVSILRKPRSARCGFPRGKRALRRRVWREQNRGGRVPGFCQFVRALWKRKSAHFRNAQPFRSRNYKTGERSGGSEIRELVRYVS